MIKATSLKLITPDKKTLLSNVNFECKVGSFTHFYGANGCGKSSLIKSLAGIEMKLSGLINQFKSFYYLPQIENKEFMLPIQIKDISNSGTLLKDQERIHSWNKASGGQRKKALIERAFAQNCELFLLDEPFNHLDEESINKVNIELTKLIEHKKTIIMVSHKAPNLLNDQTIFSLDVEQWK